MSNNPLPSSLHTPAPSLDEYSTPKILCVDDDPNIPEAFARRLHSYDIEVLRAFHGMQGYWIATTEKPDVIITDLQMPQGEGEQIIECLLRNSDTENIPIIVLTGKDDPGLESKLLDLGADYFLRKPASIEEILDILYKHIPLRKRAKE